MEFGVIDYDTTVSYETLRTHSERIHSCPGQTGIGWAAFPECQVRGASEHAEEQVETEDRDLPSTEIGNAVSGCHRIAGGRNRNRGGLEGRGAHPRLEKDAEGPRPGRTHRQA